MKTVRVLWVAIGLATVVGCTGDESAEPNADPTSTVVTSDDQAGLGAEEVSGTPSTSPTSAPSSLPASTTTLADQRGSAGRTDLSGPITLRGDGLGDARFGDPLSTVEPWLSDQFGLPRTTATAWPPLAASQPWEADEGVYVAAFPLGTAGRTSAGYWNEGLLQVVFSDVGPGTDDGTLRLVGWETVRRGAPPLATESGLMIGTSEEELLTSFPDTQRSTDRFEIVSAPTGEAGIRGLIEAENVTRLAAGVDVRELDDIPDPPPTPEGPVVDELRLRPDGIGEVAVESPAEGLISDLESRFGPPTEASTIVGSPGSLRSWGGYFPDSSAQILTWFDPGLTIVVADGEAYGGSIPGQLRLVNWTVTGPRLQLETDVGVGSTVEQLAQTYDDITFGVSDECVDRFNPEDFAISTDDGDLRGSLDWRWVLEVQDALNARGASLEIDGAFGPVTREALADYQEGAGIAASDGWDSDGEIGPETLAALGVTAPDDALIVQLAGGIESSCGERTPFGVSGQ